MKSLTIKVYEKDDDDQLGELLSTSKETWDDKIEIHCVACGCKESTWSMDNRFLPEVSEILCSNCNSSFTIYKNVTKASRDDMKKIKALGEEIAINSFGVENCFPEDDATISVENKMIVKKKIFIRKTS